MPYRELVFTVSADIAEALGDALIESGALSISVEDAAAGGYDENPLYGEPGLSPEVQAWDSSSLTALFEFDTPIKPVLEELRNAGFEFDTPLEKKLEDQDWVRLTQSQFEPIHIGRRIWIIPSWHDKPNDPEAICLAVDPGLAFGTGSHPTTSLCLQWLEIELDQRQSQNPSLLDYGCGSGILAIAARKLGCNPVAGIDIDPQAIESAQANSIQNQVDIGFYLPGTIEENARFDIVVANILANPLQVLAPALIKRIKPNGKLVLSGILNRQASDVIETYRPWVTLSVWKEQDSWVCLHGTLNQSAAISTPNQRPRTIFLGAFLVCFFGLMIVTSLWQAPILHALSPRMDELPNPVQQIAFSGINQLQTRICKIMPCRQNRIEDFTAWRLVLVNLGMESQNQAVAQNKTEFESILEVQIQNRLLVPIAWPNLELSLTDTDDKLIAQIQLKPQEWVPKAWQASHPAFLLEGAPDQALIDAAIPLQLPNHAAGYRLRISYPPKI